MKCKHCNGTGETKKFTTLYDTKTKMLWQKTKLCLHCLGDGEIDWIENITGKDISNAGTKIQTHWSTEWVCVMNYEMPAL